MAAFANFLEEMLIDGRIVLSSPPTEEDDSAALEVLRRAHETQSLSLAGPVLALDETVAVAAGRLLRWSAWYYLNPGITLDAAAKVLTMPLSPTTPAHHLSGDLCLRFLPALHRRAHALMPSDELPRRMEQTLRAWPLSGVLADISAAPTTPIDFGAHAGLNFLYAERLLEHERTSWFPQGHALQVVELVWRELGKSASVVPAFSATDEGFME